VSETYEPERALHEGFSSAEVDVPSGRLFYIDEGDGPPVVLVHGSPLSSFAFRHQVAALRDRFRVLVPDLPGFGRSTCPEEGLGFPGQAAALRAWLDTVDPGEIRLLGHDWGGPVAMGCAARRPEQVRQLVLMNTTVRPGFQPPAYWRAFTARWLGDRLIVDADLFGRGLPLLLRAARSAPIRRQYRKPFRNRAMRRTVLALERQDGYRELMDEVVAALPRMKVPTMILWGHPDPYFRKGEVALLQALFEHAELRRIPGGGHFPQEDATDAVTDALVDFFG